MKRLTYKNLIIGAVCMVTSALFYFQPLLQRKLAR